MGKRASYKGTPGQGLISKSASEELLIAIFFRFPWQVYPGPPCQALHVEQPKVEPIASKRCYFR